MSKYRATSIYGTTSAYRKHPANCQSRPRTGPHPCTENVLEHEQLNAFCEANCWHLKNVQHYAANKPQQTNIFLTNSFGGYEEIVLWLIYKFLLNGLKGSAQLTDKTLKQILWMSLRGYSNWECNSLKYNAGNSCHSVSWMFICYVTTCSITVWVFLQKARKCSGKPPAVNWVASLKTQGTRQNGSQ